MEHSTTTQQDSWEAAFAEMAPSPAEVEAERAYLAHLDRMEDYADYLAHQAEQEAAEREAEEQAEAARLQAVREERGRLDAPFFEFFLVPRQVGHYYCQSTSGRIYRVGPDSCSCPDFQHTCQPLGIACKHLVARREWSLRGSLPTALPDRGPVVVGYTTGGGRITLEKVAKAAEDAHLELRDHVQAQVAAALAA